MSIPRILVPEVRPHDRLRIPPAFPAGAVQGSQPTRSPHSEGANAPPERWDMLRKL